MVRVRSRWSLSNSRSPPATEQPSKEQSLSTSSRGQSWSSISVGVSSPSVGVSRPFAERPSDDAYAGSPWRLRNLARLLLNHTCTLASLKLVSLPKFSRVWTQG